MPIRITVDSSKAVVKLQGIQDAIKDLRPAADALFAVFTDFMAKRFDSEGAYAGQTWTPLSPGYAKWKATHYPGQTILRLTDRMYGSLTSRTGDTLFRVTTKRFEFGTRVPYAKKHQRGLDGMKVLPVITKYTQAEIAETATVLLEYIMRGELQLRTR